MGLPPATFPPERGRDRAIVTDRSDDGGSSGALRKEYDVPPARGHPQLPDRARAGGAGGVRGAQCRFDVGAAQHPVGNLLLAALDMVARLMR